MTSELEAILFDRNPSLPRRRRAGPARIWTKNIGRQLPPQIFLRFRRVTELPLELLVEHADLRGQYDEMHERIGMRDNENPHPPDDALICGAGTAIHLT
jgi:hypothetical protein